MRSKLILIALILTIAFLGGRTWNASAKTATSIKCSVSPSTLTLGDAVTVSGEITPQLVGVDVIITYTRPDKTTLVRKTITSLKSTYADSYRPDAIGSWSVVASWTGNDIFEGATSSPESFTVVGLPSRTSKITCMTDYSSTVLGGQIGIYGAIIPAISASVVIEVSVDGGSWSTLATISSTSNGSYSYTWTPNRAGAYSIRSRWSGDGSLGGATSNIVYVVVHSVEEPDFKISADPLSRTVEQGQTTSFAVALVSLHGFNQKVSLSGSDLPGGATGSFNPSSLSGNASSTFSVSTSSSTPIGTYELTITASGPGKTLAVHVTLNVKAVGMPSRCLVATATFGSELAFEVQLLRAFRDRLVLSTFAGRGFMSAFDSWYYSFSPFVAELISAHPTTRLVMRVLLYPLIEILHIVAQAYPLSSSSSELAVIMVGLMSCSLIGTAYLLPLMFLLEFSNGKRSGRQD